MASKSFVLNLTQEEQAVLNASLFHRLEETASFRAEPQNEALPASERERLRILMERAEEMRQTKSAHMELSPDELALLNQHILHSFGFRGYIVGRPGALTALASLQRKLARLKEGQGRLPSIIRLLRRIMRLPNQKGR